MSPHPELADFDADFDAAFEAYAALTGALPAVPATLTPVLAGELWGARFGGGHIVTVTYQEYDDNNYFEIFVDLLVAEGVEFHDAVCELWDAKVSAGAAIDLEAQWYTVQNVVQESPALTRWRAGIVVCVHPDGGPVQFHGFDQTGHADGNKGMEVLLGWGEVEA